MRRMMLSWAAFVLVCGGATAAELARVGRKIDDFGLRDYRGQMHSLSQLADSKLVVVAFLGTDCPLAKLYGPRLAEVSKQFAERGVTFIGINSNQQDSNTEVAAHARIHGIEFPVLKDLGNEVADRFGAVRTPEVFVLDADRVVRYWGRIDDQYGVGYQRPEATHCDLVAALEELLAGRTVSQPETNAPGCYIGRVQKVEAKGDVTYSKQIARIIDKHCVECHREGEIAPFPLRSYEDVVGWAETILEVVNDGRMPPWSASPEFGHFKNNPRLDEEERQTLEAWVRNGAPQGNSADMPPAREFTVGWGIPQPDQIVHMSDQPYTVPAEGVVEYQYFTVDPGWTEDKWILASEARPDNRAVVHHIICFFEPPNSSKDVRGRGGLTGYAPGMPPIEHSEGAAIFVPAGSKLVFQMHYTPNGSVQKDRSYVGIKFADPDSVKFVARGGLAPNFLFEIPAGADNHQVVSKYKFRRETLLTSLTPHMHLRGKSFRYEVAYPDGTKEVLLDVPRYDFNWQLRYEFVEPKRMPAGTRMVCTAHFDNSANNLANPDPTKPVRWGDQTWEEMMIGWFSTLSPRGEPEEEEESSGAGGE